MSPAAIILSSLLLSCQSPTLEPTPLATEQPKPVTHQEQAGSPIIPLIFPVLHKVTWSDTFGASRGGGRRRHLGQDLPAPKMTPLVACFDGTVEIMRSEGVGGHNMLFLDGDNGIQARYMHVNNDTPGTDDGRGTAEYAFPAGLHSGDHVVAGQLVGWVGDSGNAESTIPHCHFELWDGAGAFNATALLKSARHIFEPALSLDVSMPQAVDGETQLEGIVRISDPARGVIQVDILSVAGRDRTMHSIRMPQRRWIRLARCKLVARDDENRFCGSRDIVAGAKVVVIARAGKAGETVTARKIVFTMQDPEEEEVPLRYIPALFPEDTGK